MTTIDCGLNQIVVADFLSGFVHGFTGNDHKAYFETCLVDTPAFEADMCDAVNKIATKDNQQVIQAVQEILGDMPELNGFMAGCPDAANDIAVTGNWFKYWKSQGEMKVYSTAYKNIIANMDTLKTDAAALEADYDAQDYYGTADMAASVAKLALPVPAGFGATIDCGLSQTVVADFLAGFVHGFTGNDHKAYFETCLIDTPAFEADMCDAVNKIATKDNQQVVLAVQEILGDMPELNGFLAGCPDASADIAVTAGWFTYWKSQGEMKVYSTAYKNVVGNMATISADATTLEADYDAQDYYGTADMASTIAKIALPVQSAEFLQ